MLEPEVATACPSPAQWHESIKATRAAEGKLRQAGVLCERAPGPASCMIALVKLPLCRHFLPEYNYIVAAELHGGCSVHRMPRHMINNDHSIMLSQNCCSYARVAWNLQIKQHLHSYNNISQGEDGNADAPIFHFLFS